MHLIQITDLHIGLPNEMPFEVDVRANFQKILTAIQAQSCDLLVISGDLCYQDGDRQIYDWIKIQLDQLNCAWVIIPGNHDKSSLLANSLGLEKDCQDEQLFFCGKTDDPPMLFLDSAKGYLSALQLNFLQDYLAQHQREICLFMHHPPLKAGVPYMDNHHAFQNSEETLAILTAHPYPIHIFTGHYHVDKSVSYKNLNVYITPSTFFQIDWREQDFKVDHHRCAYRRIFWDGDRLEQGLVWVD
jgi:Icc protein